MFQPTCHLPASYSMCLAVGVAVFVVYHFVLFYGPGTQNSLVFLNAKSNLNLTKIVSVRLMDSDLGKLSDFDNIQV